ncbi:Methyltransferase domain-containing protein [Geodermatophilus telluris]|uniref:Methyltransferase domain-containing protein n=1 Tax=Geodermatophilus telluris TaxID=1190417 RepID=A0A1G6MAU6_9ACTN|nr:class I SAM-dependent methyltransferase [Geodermatophilus telluris]SDC52551.1 Methyltransferase domain-containing protein [Geodermatophilus telluris]
MARLISPRALLELLRTGDARARWRAAQDGQAALRLQVVSAALDTGVLDELARAPAGTAELARRTGVTEPALLEAFLRVAAVVRLVDGDGAGWRLGRAGRAVVGDDLVRASYQGFGGFHTDLYRGLRAVLAGGTRRRDVAERGEVIARMSAGFDVFVHDLLVRTVAERRPRRVLDVGCGAGLQLAGMLEAAPAASGVGVDVDAEAAALAARTLRERGLADRATVEAVDVRTALATGPAGALAEPFDLALLANVVYYLPPAERVPLLRAVAGLLAPGGTLLVVTTAAAPQLFSRHMDLLLRAQDGDMQLPDADSLVRQLAEAGLDPQPPRSLVPGTPLIAVSATRG